MTKLISAALLTSCLVLTTGCPSTDGPGVETGQFGVTINWTDQFGGAGLVDCTSVELVVVSGAGDVFRDPGLCDQTTWATGLLPLGSYAAQVNVYDVNGQVSGQSEIVDTSIDLDGELVELSFTIVEDAGSFAFSYGFVVEGTETALTCAETGVAMISLETTFDTDPVELHQFPCRDSAPIEVSGYVPLGAFSIQVSLQDGNGADINVSPAESHNIDYGGQVNDLGDFVFEFAP